MDNILLSMIGLLVAGFSLGFVFAGELSRDTKLAKAIKVVTVVAIAVCSVIAFVVFFLK